MRTKFRVISPHGPETEDVLNVKKGARLKFERKPTKWEGWLWCTSPDGVSAWVPEPWVDVKEGHCVMRKDYVSRELTLKPGEEVSGWFTESGWAWVRTAVGDEGWAPLECLERMEG